MMFKFRLWVMLAVMLALEIGVGAAVVRLVTSILF
jgi:hypothetical protein